MSAAESALVSAREDFCGAAKGYVETLDRYGRVFTDRSATVGDVQTLGADLVEPRDEVIAAADAVETAKGDLAAAQQELVDAQAALAAAIADRVEPSGQPTTATTVTTHHARPRGDDRARPVGRGRPRPHGTRNQRRHPAGRRGSGLQLGRARTRDRLAATADDAECLSEDRQADAVAQLTAYTTALQTDLQRAGYDPGPIDGVYGPQTVAAVEQLQTDSGLPVTGFVDEATARALQDKLDAVGQQVAQEATQTAALQTILKLTGFWDGPIDGQWTDELTQALMSLQTALGVEPTGVVDAATVAAFQQALATRETSTTSVTTATVVTTATATTTATAVTTATATTTATAVTTAPIAPPTTTG